MKTTGLSHIHLAVRDLERSERFYSGLFGLEVMFRVPPDMVFMQTPGAQDVITLRQAGESEEIGPGGVGHFGFAVAPEHFQDALAEAQAFGAEILEVGEFRPGQPFAYMKDPDGYVIEL